MRHKVIVAVLVTCAVLMVQDRALPCELLGFSFNEEVPANQIFEAFRYRGKHNSDGWGVAYYQGNSVQIFKEPKKALNSELADFLQNYKSFRTSLLVAHVRSASQGGIIHASTHPFDRELNGRKWVLVHNGNVAIDKLTLGRFKPLSMCDSEHLFCHILNKIEAKNISQWDKSTFEWVQDMLRETNDAGYMNCIFSDGEHLFVYRDKGPHECCLHYIVRKGPYGMVHFKEPNKDVNLGEIYKESTHGVVFATEPETTEKWVGMKRGQLIVVKGGEIVYEGNEVN